MLSASKLLPPKGSDNDLELFRRMFKKNVQRGRSKRWAEAYSLPYVEALSEARTKLADFFNILLERGLD